MKIEIMIAVLGIICIGALAAVFVLWAKIDEQKQNTADEHANYLAALNLHNAAAERACALDEKYAVLKTVLHETNQERIELQDFKSKTLCPHNDHVWKDGVCVKCGRMNDAEIH